MRPLTSNKIFEHLESEGTFQDFIRVTFLYIYSLLGIIATVIVYFNHAINSYYNGYVKCKNCCPLYPEQSSCERKVIKIMARAVVEGYANSKLCNYFLLYVMKLLLPTARGNTCIGFWFGKLELEQFFQESGTPSLEVY